jgi:DNA-binding LacI/PurR family transcriptional regulator
MKHLRISSLLERRIQKGDYAITGIPGERDLADDIGVSRVTLRKALEELEAKGLLERAPNRRLVLTSKARSAIGELQLAFVSPSIAPQSFSPDLQLWLAAVERVARQRGDRVRVVNYHHWDDPTLTEAIRTFDGIFLVTSSEPIPRWTEELLTEANCIVAISEDLAHFDIPSIVLFPPRLIGSMMQRLQQLGHRRIDCINVQGHNVITKARINEWDDWRRSEEVSGELVDDPCSVDDNIYEAGIEVARKWIRRIDEGTTAVLCVTLPAALGVIRAASELGMSIGSELSVCTIDGEGIGKFLSPSIASFERPDPTMYMNACVDWFASGGKVDTWEGPLLLEPSKLDIFEGRSIGPPQHLSRNGQVFTLPTSNTPGNC